MKFNLSKRRIYLFTLFFLMIGSGFFFQNCSPALFNIQRGFSAKAGENVSDFLKNSEDEIKVTKEELKGQEVFSEENTVSSRSLASEDEAIIETKTASGKIKLGLRKKEK